MWTNLVLIESRAKKAPAEAVPQVMVFEKPRKGAGQEPANHHLQRYFAATYSTPSKCMQRRKIL